MNSLQRENFRRAILMVMDANQGPHGVGLPALRLLVGHYGFYPSSEDTQFEVEYLIDKGMVANLTKTISPENRFYRITASGRDFLASTFPVPPTT